VCKGRDDQYQPDAIDATLCCGCGNPHDLKACSACRCAHYCSVACQKSEWKAFHKKQCPKEKVRFETWQKEERTDKPDPNRFVDGGLDFLKKFDPKSGT
jgi:hypothetical protein